VWHLSANVSYGRQLAAAAGVTERVTFVVADVLQLPKEELTGVPWWAQWPLALHHLLVSASGCQEVRLWSGRFWPLAHLQVFPEHW